jgi:hypothetical protein
VTTGRALPSDPVRQGVIRLPVDTPVGLSLVEDSMGWETARAWPLRPPPDARVLEVAGPADWVRLTVAGYLSTAGRALPVDVPGLGRPAQTVLAGWDPDTTWWLTDVLTGGAQPIDWIRKLDDPALWLPR